MAYMFLPVALLLFTLFPAPTPAQTASGEENLYHRALVACLDEKVKAYAKIDPTRDYYDVVIARNDELTKDWPTQVGKYRVTYLDAEGLIKRYQERGKEFPILVTRPMINSGARLEISFTDYRISYKKPALNYALEGGCKVMIRYDCPEGKYVIEKVELWGV